MQIHRNVIPKNEIDSILNMIKNYHPEVFLKNTYNENVDEGLQHLKFLPLNYIPVIGSCIDFVLLSSVNSTDDYGGRLWHSDGDSCETSILLYLQGDPNSGGEFCIEQEKHKFEVGMMIIMNSSVLHKVEPYNNSLSRIALKWKFR